MGKSDFLENLRNSVETGNFNSEAADRIKKISQLAENKSSLGTEKIMNNINNRLDDNKRVLDDEDNIEELNQEYENNIFKIEKIDEANKKYAEILNIENNFIIFAEQLKNKMDEFIESYYDDEDVKDIYLIIDNLKKKYNV